MKPFNVLIISIMVTVGNALGQSEFTTIDDVNKATPLGSLISGPPNLGVQGNVVNPFTGSVSLSVPILPGITLLYSSINVPQLMNYENRDMQCSSVGAGWTLELGGIIADLKGTTDISDDDWYYISPDGSRTKIVKDAAGVYRLQNNPYWKVELSMNGDLVNGITVTTDNGSKMRFGDFETGRNSLIGPQKANRCVLHWGPRVTDFSNATGGEQICYRWDLSRVLYPHGIVIADVYYTQEQVAVNGVTYTRASYPDYILNQRTGQKIDFVQLARDPSEYEIVEASNSKIQLYETQSLSQIKVFPSAQSNLPFLTFDLGTQLISNGTKTKHLLTSITQRGLDNAALPSLVFGYDPLNQYILNSIQNPTGGVIHINGQSQSYGYLNQANDGAATIIDGISGMPDSSYRASASGTTIARYDMNVGQLKIEKWVGTWKPQIFGVSNPKPNTGCNRAYLSVSDNHIALVYKQANGIDELYVYDWRSIDQTWTLGLSVSANSIESYYDAMVATLSPSGSHLLFYVADSIDTDAGTRFPCMRSWQWSEVQQEWQSTGGVSGSQIAGGDHDWYVESFTATEDMVLLQNQDGTCVYQFGTPANPTWHFVFSDSWNDGVRRFFLTANYIGYWDTGNGQLRTENFVYDPQGYASVSEQYMGDFYTGDYDRRTTYPIFTDQRILLCEYSGPTSTVEMRANIHVWVWNGSGFTPVQNIWTNVGADGDAAPYYWYNTRFYGIDNYQWDLNCRITDDWVFVFQHRTGGSGDYNPFEGQVWAYRWNSGLSKYDDAGTYTYPVTQGSDDYFRMFMSSEVLLSNDHFIVTSNGCAAIGSYPTRDGFTDVFPLDRVSPTSWSSNRYRLFSDNGYYSYRFGRTNLLVGNNFVGVSSPVDGEVKAKLFHNIDKDWANGVTGYSVSQIDVSGMIGPDVITNYSYNVNPTFDPSLVAPGFATVTTLIDQNGYTKTYFNNSLDDPLLRGSVTKIESYSQGSSTAIQQWVPTWSVYHSPNASYLFQIRKTAESSTLDGLTKSTSYDYEDSNGQIDKITEHADAVSDLGGTHDRVTEISFAFQQYGLMTSANMLVQLYETKESAYSAADGVSHLLSWRRTEYDANNYPVRSLVYDGTNLLTTNTVISRDAYGNVRESQDVSGVHSTTKYGFNSTVPIAAFINADNNETFYENFEGAGGWDANMTSYDSNLAYTGKYSGRIDKPTSGEQYSFNNTWTNVSLTAQKTFRYSGWVYSNGPTADVYLFMKRANETGYYSYIDQVTTSVTNRWVYLEKEFPVPADVAFLNIRLDNNGGGTVWFDDVCLCPANSQSSFQAYDPNTLQVTSKTDANSVSTNYAYDTFGRLSDTRNDDGNIVSHTDYYYSRNIGNNFVFDPAYPNYTRATTYPGSDGSNPLISTIYTDGLGRMLQAHSRNGPSNIISAVEYDNAGRQYRAWRPYSGSTTYNPAYAANAQSAYNNLSNPYSETIYCQDPLSRVHFTKPSGCTTDNEWVENKYGSATVNGALLSYTESLQKVGSNIAGRTGSRVYTDKLGRAVRQETYVEGSAGISTGTVYTMLGMPIATTDPNGYISTSMYNSFLGTLTQQTTVDNGTSNYLYDNAGRLRFMIDAVGWASSPNKTLYWKYDVFGRVIEKGYISQNWIEMASHVRDQSYPSTPATWRKKYDYDDAAITSYARGRLCKVQTNNDDDSNFEVEEIFQYDKYGNVLSVTTSVPDFSSSSYTISYTYDLLGRVIQIQYPAQATVTQVQNVTVMPSNPYTATSASTLTVGPAFTIQTGATATVAAKQSVRLIVGFRASAGSQFRAWIDPTITDGGTSAMAVSYKYDQLGRVNDVGNGSDDDFYAHYDYNNPGGSMSQEKLNNQGSTTSYQYNNSRGSLTQISNPAFTEDIAYSGGYGGSSYYNGSIAYDSFVYPGGWPVSYAYSLLYDEHNRMTVADNTSGSYSAYDYGVTSTMQYDNNGNMRVRPTGSSGQNMFVYYPGTNRLMNINGSTDDHVLQYDAAGNLVANTGRGINPTYDPFTQLMKSVSGSGTNVSFQYDGRKERVLKTVNTSGSVTSTLYLRGTNDYPLTEKIGNGGSTTDRFYVYGPTPNGASGLVAVVEGGATYFVVKDHLGSTRAVLNSSNTAITWFSYDVYGTNIGSLVNQDVRYKFTGQELDAGFGSDELYNFRAREYDPRLGIFYASDAAGQGFSPYMYVGGNPVMRVDPTGRLWWLAAAEVLYDIYQAYTAASMAYGAYQAISSGNFENMLRFGMHSAFTIAGMGVSGSEPGGYYAADWAERAAVGGGLSVAGYYTGGGQGWKGGLGAFGEGAGASLLGMGIQYGKVSNWQMPVSTDDPTLLSLQAPVMYSPTSLTMSTIGAPNIPELQYEQSTGEARYIYPSGNNEFSGTGYAGYGEGLNNPDMENIKNAGPLPRGIYIIGPMQDYTKANGNVLRNAMMLTPVFATQGVIASYGRGGPFLIHGASQYMNPTESLGCIVLRPIYRYPIGNSLAKILRVIR